jgi:hypothetical protein
MGDPQFSDELGNITFTIDKGFTGIVQFTKDGDMTGIYIFNPALDRDLDAVPIQLVTPMIATALTSLVHTPYNTERGLILLNVANCNGMAAPGVAISRDGAPIPVKECPTDLTCEKPFYAINGIPNGDAEETDSSAYNGFINVPAGSAVVTAKVKATDLTIGTVSLIVRAGGITYAKMVPIGK